MSTSSTLSFNQGLTMNRVSEVHPNQGHFIKMLGADDYQFNTQPIGNFSCGCAGVNTATKKQQQQINDGTNPWNVSNQMQPKNTMCPYVLNFSSVPGDNGMTTFCATQM